MSHPHKTTNMKKLLFIIIMLTGCQVYGQTTVNADLSGNFRTLESPREVKAKDTGKTFTDSKGIVYPVYVSVNGKLFVIRTSKKTGKKYNQYLTIKN